MTNDEILKVAKPYQWNGGLVEGWTINTTEHLIAFAQAIAKKAMDEQKQEDVYSVQMLRIESDPRVVVPGDDYYKKAISAILSNNAQTEEKGIPYVATLKFNHETRIVRGIIKSDKEST